MTPNATRLCRPTPACCAAGESTFDLSCLEPPRGRELLPMGGRAPCRARGISLDRIKASPRGTVPVAARDADNLAYPVQTHPSTAPTGRRASLRRSSRRGCLRMLAVEVYVWRYETSMPEIVARVLVFAAAVAGSVLVLRRDAPWQVSRPLKVAAGVLIAALILRLFAARVLPRDASCSGLLSPRARWRRGCSRRAPGPRWLRRALVPRSSWRHSHFLLLRLLPPALRRPGDLAGRSCRASSSPPTSPQVPDLVAVLPVEPVDPVRRRAPLLYRACFWPRTSPPPAPISEALARRRRPKPSGARGAAGARRRRPRVLAAVVPAGSPRRSVGDWFYRSIAHRLPGPARHDPARRAPDRARRRRRAVGSFPDPLQCWRATAGSRRPTSAPGARSHQRRSVLITVDALRADQDGRLRPSRATTRRSSTRLHREGRLVSHRQRLLDLRRSRSAGWSPSTASKYWHQVAPNATSPSLDVLKRLGYRSHFFLERRSHEPLRPAQVLRRRHRRLSRRPPRRAAT